MYYDFGFPLEILNTSEGQAIWIKDFLERAMSDLSCSFDWERTEEGEEFWRNVYYRMARILHTGN